MGNKIDKGDFQVPTKEAASYALENGLLFMEVSAKEETNIKELFNEISKKLPRESTKPDRIL